MSLINYMEPKQIYILISILVLLIIGIIIFLIKKNKNQKPLTFLAGLAFAFVLAGTIFGDNRLIGYSLIGIGVFLAIIDIFRKLQKRNNKSKK